MVGVSHGFCDYLPCIVPAVAAFVEEYSHKFGYCERRVRVVYVDGNLFGEVIHCAEYAQMSVNYILN